MATSYQIVQGYLSQKEIGDTVNVGLVYDMLGSIQGFFDADENGDAIERNSESSVSYMIRDAAHHLRIDLEDNGADGFEQEFLIVSRR